MALPVIDLKARKASAAGEEDEGASSAQKDLDRPTAQQIFDQVAENARGELERTTVSLAISGIAGGLLMGLTGMSVSILLSMVGNTPAGEVAAYFFYPLGFMVVILGRSQLFTENTLYPVALMLDERRHYLATARLWATVFPANVVGAFLFALLAVKTGALRPEYVAQLVKLGTEAQTHRGEPCLLERRGGRVDYRHSGMAGERESLHHRLGAADLDDDLYRRPGALCPLHRDERGDPERGAGRVSPHGRVLRLATTGHAREYYGWGAAGHAAGVRAIEAEVGAACAAPACGSPPPPNPLESGSILLAFPDGAGQQLSCRAGD